MNIPGFCETAAASLSEDHETKLFRVDRKANHDFQWSPTHKSRHTPPVWLHETPTCFVVCHLTPPHFSLHLLIIPSLFSPIQCMDAASFYVVQMMLCVRTWIALVLFRLPALLSFQLFVAQSFEGNWRLVCSDDFVFYFNLTYLWFWWLVLPLCCGMMDHCAIEWTLRSAHPAWHCSMLPSRRSIVTVYLLFRVFACMKHGNLNVLRWIGPSLLTIPFLSLSSSFSLGLTACSSLNCNSMK